MNTIDDLKRANKAAGRYWFSPDTMRFFGTRIESDLHRGRWFVTSEKPPHGPRAYTVRVASADGSDIDTVGDLCGYTTKARAIEAMHDAIAADET